MTYHQRDAWDDAGDSGNGIEGQHLKCAKGRWLLDNEEVETGDGGIKVCFIMDSATVGSVLWLDQKIAERNVGRLSDGFPKPSGKDIEPGWNPYTAVMGVRADDGHLGELVTFTSSSWGGWYAFQKLINPWRSIGRTAFPLCVLSTKERGDANHNIDPIFKRYDWSARKNFAALLPPEEVAAIASSPSEASPARAPRAAEIIDDDIPF